MAQKKVGDLIKEARTKAGLSQEKLASMVEGLSASEVSKAERGEKDLTQAELKAVAGGDFHNVSSNVYAATNGVAFAEAAAAVVEVELASTTTTFEFEAEVGVGVVAIGVIVLI